MTDPQDDPKRSIKLVALVGVLGSIRAVVTFAFRALIPKVA